MVKQSPWVVTAPAYVAGALVAWASAVAVALVVAARLDADAGAALDARLAGIEAGMDEAGAMLAGIKAIVDETRALAAGVQANIDARAAAALTCDQRTALQRAILDEIAGRWAGLSTRVDGSAARPVPRRGCAWKACDRTAEGTM